MCDCSIGLCWFLLNFAKFDIFAIIITIFIFIEFDIFAIIVFDLFCVLILKENVLE